MAKRRTKEKVVSKKFVARREREEQQAALVRNIMIGIVVVVILLVGFGFADQALLQPNKAVATVNGEKITVKDFQARVRLERQGLISQYIQYLQFGQIYGMDFTAQLDSFEASLNNPIAIGQSVVDNMVNELIYQFEAEKLGITVSAEAVESEIRNILGYYPDGTPTATPAAALPEAIDYPTLSPEQLAIVTITPTATTAPTSTPAPTATPLEATPEAAEETNAATAIPTVDFTGMDVTPTPYTEEGYTSEYQNMLDYYAEVGISEDTYRGLLEAQLAFDALYDEITADAPTTGEEIWARHILLPDDALAKLTLDRLAAGEDFGALAAELSIEPGAAESGGDLGWFGKGRMVPEFEEAAFALENIGDLSGVVESQFGFHVIQLLGRQVRPLDEAAYEAARSEIFSDWLTSVRDEYEIVTYDDLWMVSVPTDPDLNQSLQEAFGQ